MQIDNIIATAFASTSPIIIITTIIAIIISTALFRNKRPSKKISFDDILKLPNSKLFQLIETNPQVQILLFGETIDNQINQCLDSFQPVDLQSDIIKTPIEKIKFKYVNCARLKKKVLDSIYNNMELPMEFLETNPSEMNKFLASKIKGSYENGEEMYS